MGTRILNLVLLAGLASALASCEKRSTLYCEKNPEDRANCEQMDAAVAPPTRCESNAMCAAPTPLCELVGGVCVECLTTADCANGGLCDPDRFECRGCLSSADCGGEACLPDGTCGADATVLYVDAATGDDTNDCTFAARCSSLEHAATLVTSTRRTIDVRGAWTESVVLNGQDLQIIAEPGAVMTGTSDDWVIKIQNSQVQIYGLTLACVGDQTGVKTEMGSTTTLSGMTITNCGRAGAVEAKGGFTVVTRSVLAFNPDGAITTDASANWSITNNFIHHNGPGRAAVAIGSDPRPADQRFEFNTVVDNTATAIAGITCTDPTVMPNNLIARNGLAGLANTSTCDVSGSLVSETVMPLYFKSSEAEPYDYHLDSAMSSARDNAPDGSSVNEDYDGEVRPQGDAKDFGADEYRAMQ